MYASLKKLKNIRPLELDHLLKNGWFRISGDMFTTSFISFENKQYDAIWLRIKLDKIEFSKSQREILKRSKNFKIITEKLTFDEEMTELYQKYRNAQSFQLSMFLNYTLDDSNHLFNSYVVKILDGDRLIACGVFDLGQEAAAGIISFYDPEYRKYSLGKLLILHKILFCKTNGIKWLYPGYIVPGYSKFDYKLGISKNLTEYYDNSYKIWKPISSLNVERQALNRMFHALSYLEKSLQTSGVTDIAVKKYRFFDIMIDSAYSQYNLLSYPYFLQLFSNSQNEELIIVYDTISSCYKLLLCHKVFSVNTPPIENYYTSYLLREATVLISEKNHYPFLFSLLDIISKAIY